MLTIYDTKSSIEPLKYSRLASSTKFTLSVFENSFFNDNKNIWQSLNPDINGFEALNDEPFSYSFSTEWDKGPGFKAAEKLNGFVKDDIIKMISGEKYVSLPVTNEWSQKFAQKASPLSLSLKFKASAIPDEIASCTAIQIIRFLTALTLPPKNYSLNNLYGKIVNALDNATGRTDNQMDDVASNIARRWHDQIKESNNIEDLKKNLKVVDKLNKKVMTAETKQRQSKAREAIIAHIEKLFQQQNIKSFDDELTFEGLDGYKDERIFKKYILNHLNEDAIEEVLKNSTPESAECKGSHSKLSLTDKLIEKGEKAIKNIVGLSSDISKQPRGQYTVTVLTPDMNNTIITDWYVKSFSFKPSVQYIMNHDNIYPVYVEFNVELETTMELSNEQIVNIFVK